MTVFDHFRHFFHCEDEFGTAWTHLGHPTHLAEKLRSWANSAELADWCAALTVVQRARASASLAYLLGQEAPLLEEGEHPDAFDAPALVGRIVSFAHTAGAVAQHRNGQLAEARLAACRAVQTWLPPDLPDADPPALAAWLEADSSPTTTDGMELDVLVGRLGHHLRARHPEAPWTVGPVRDLLAFIASAPPRLVLQPAWLPVLFAALGGGLGALRRLHFEVLAGGTGDLYPHPLYMGTIALSEQFLASPVDALASAEQYARSRPGAILLVRSDVDIRWWIDLPPVGAGKPAPLSGPSLGGAFGYALSRLLLRARVDPRYTLTATLDRKGNLGHVEQVMDKARAFFAEPNNYGGPAVRRLVVATEANRMEARQAAEKERRRDTDLAVAQAPTLTAALDRIDEYETLQYRSLYANRELCPGSVHNFRQYYLRNDEKAVAVFGGREAELARLDTLLDPQSSTRYLLVHGKAGMGKSHLLVHWLDQLSDGHRERLSIVFVPVSSRYETNSPGLVYSLLANQLALVFGETSGAGQGEAHLRSLVQGYLRTNRAKPHDRLVLIVLDGIDELLPHRLDPGLFSHPAPDWLRVVVSARDRDQDTSYWLRHLNWWNQRGVDCLEVQGLDLAGVAQVLYSAPLPHRTEELARQLYRVSQGYPLLVRLLVNLLRGKPGAPSVTGDDLAKIRPGLEEVFEYWHARLKRDSEAVADLVDRIEAVLATALGRLPRRDLNQLAEIDPPREGRRLEQAWAALSYFVDSGPKGDVFGHPEFAAVLREKQGRIDPAIRAGWRERFMQWGREELDALMADEDRIQSISPYLVRHYGAHLEEGLAGKPEEALKVLELLLGERWCAACQRHDVDGLGNYALYLGEVERTLRLTQTAHERAAGRGQRLRYLGLEVRCLLIEASIRSLAANIWPEMLVALVEAGQWSFSQALAYAENKHLGEEQMASISALARNCPVEHFPDLLLAARSIRHVRWRSRTLANIALRLPGGQGDEVFQQALQAARDIEDAHSRSYALAEIAQRLPDAQQALQVARDIKKAYYRSFALAGIAPRLSGGQGDEVFQQALQAAWDVEDGHARAVALMEIAPRLPDAQQCGAILQKLLQASRNIENAFYRGLALLDVAPELPNALEALQVARDIEDVCLRSRALIRIAPRLPGAQGGEVLHEALQVARAIESLKARSDTLVEIARQLPNAQCGEIIQLALQDARGIEEPEKRSSALAKIASLLPGAQGGKVLQEALQAARDIKRKRAPGIHKLARADQRHRHENTRSAALVKIASLLPDAQGGEVLQEALQAAREINDTNARIIALAEIAPRLPDAQQCGAILQEALQAARNIENASDRSEALEALAPRLPDPQQGMQATRDIDAFDRSRILAMIAPRLPDARDALQAARKIYDPRYRSLALAQVAPRLPGAQGSEVLQQALKAARNVKDPNHRIWALAQIAPQLPGGQGGKLLQQALKAARNVKDAYYRSGALAQIARRLLDPQQALQVARDIECAWRRCLALAEIAPKLPDAQGSEVLQQALQTARSIEQAEDAGFRNFALAEIAPRLPAAQRRSTLEDTIAFFLAAERFDDPLARSLGGALSALTAAEFVALWPRWRRGLAAWGRPELFSALSGLLPLFNQLGDLQDIKQVVTAIQEAVARWP
jgi:hypothetical protein